MIALINHACMKIDAKQHITPLHWQIKECNSYFSNSQMIYGLTKVIYKKVRISIFMIPNKYVKLIMKYIFRSKHS